MLEFTPIEISDRSVMESKLREKNTRMTEHCFVDLFIWQNSFKTKKCIKKDFLYIASLVSERTAYYMAPIGSGNFEKAVLEIEEDAKERGLDFVLNAISAEMKNELEKTMPGRYLFTEVRDSEEYIYASKDLIALKGRKYHSKRNFINRFKLNYENRYSASEINRDNIHYVFRFLEKWKNENASKENGILSREVLAIKRGLEYFGELDLKGLVLTLDGDVIAFSYGTDQSDDTFIIQAEKADQNIKGSYAVINNEFAKMHCGGYKFINREEDMGLEGLRKAKLSYNPVFLNVKYRGRLRV